METSASFEARSAPSPYPTSTHVPRVLGGDGPGRAAGGEAEWSVQHEAGVFPWEEFRRGLIAQVARAEAAGGPFGYYETWLAAFEGVPVAKGLVRADEVEESAYAFEYGERDDVY